MNPAIDDDQKPTISYERTRNVFLISCSQHQVNLVLGLPDKRYRKASGVWAVPVLKRNVEYMVKHEFKSKCRWSREAFEAYSNKIKELQNVKTGGEKFPAWFKFKKYGPLEHQKQGLDKFYPLNDSAILFEQGLGKTFTAINLAAAWRMDNQIDSVVVVCPSSIKLVWQEQLEEHCPIEYQAHAIEAGKNKAAQKFIEEKHQFAWLVVGVEGLSQGGAHKYVTKFLNLRRCYVIVDESSKIKTHGKTRTDRCIAFGGLAKKRSILSGTSVTQGIEDLYTQFKFLNPDILGFHSFYSFRNHFCETYPMEVSPNRFVEKIVGYKNKAELMNLIRPHSLRVEKEDALDLPPKTFTDRYIKMNPMQKKLYKQMEEELRIEMEGQEYEVSMMLEQMLRLQQITGGHYPFDDGEQVVAKAIPGNNPKITELMSILDEVSGKVVIWFQFRPELSLVADALTKAGIEFVEFHGGHSDGYKKFAVKSFQKESAKVFLATKAAAYGLTLTAASTAVYFSRSFSLEEDSQSQDRIHRIGQKDPCNYIYLQCDRTVDTKVVKALREKQKIATLVYSVLKG